VGRTANIGLGLPVAAGALGAMLLLEGFLVTTLDTAVRLNRYMIEEGWATMFGRYDVLATLAAERGMHSQVASSVSPSRGAPEVVGTGGLTTESPAKVGMGGGVIATRGPMRWFLQALSYYWVNSGLAVVLMLLLGLGSGYQTVWRIFGSSNQLLAALALLVATGWLIVHRRPVWYTLAPALFMLVTSMAMLLRELVLDYLPTWPAKAPLAITAALVLAMTVGLIGLGLVRWLQLGRATAPVFGGRTEK
jgi:carbon starvation protein CstA